MVAGDLDSDFSNQLSKQLDKKYIKAWQLFCVASVGTRRVYVCMAAWILHSHNTHTHKLGRLYVRATVCPLSLTTETLVYFCYIILLDPECRELDLRRHLKYLSYHFFFIIILSFTHKILFILVNWKMSKLFWEYIC